MTTPTTPAADSVRDLFEQWVEDEGGHAAETLRLHRFSENSYRSYPELQRPLAVFRAAHRIATARESALVAELDAYKDRLFAAIEGDEILARALEMVNGTNRISPMQMSELLDVASVDRGHLSDLRYVLNVLWKAHAIVDDQSALRGEISASIVGMKYVIARTETASAPPAHVPADVETLWDGVSSTKSELQKQARL